MTSCREALQRLGAQVVACEGCGRLVPHNATERVIGGGSAYICDASDECFALLQRRYPARHFQRFYRLQPGDKLYVL